MVTNFFILTQMFPPNMSSFLSKKLDILPFVCHNIDMETAVKHANGSRHIMSRIRKRIEHGGERLWRVDDFRNLSFTAVAQALSRLTREGALERLSKGLYYHTRKTAFGKSNPNPAGILKLAKERKTVLPSGIAAANLLGFTTQVSKKTEVATTALSLPRKLVGHNMVIHTRRPETWANLSEKDAALLDFLRQGGKLSELSPKETIRKTLALLSEGERLKRLLKIAGSEPPRVRAMLGAFAERLGTKPHILRKLRASLNPFSRYDFGLLGKLPNAQAWQAKKQKPA